jgi:predicted permease
MIVAKNGKAMGSILLLLGFFALGFYLRNRMGESLRTSMALQLNRYVVYIALPALVLVYLPGVHFDNGLALPVVSAWRIYGLTVLFILLVARWARWSRSITGALLFTAPLGNTSFLGIPFTLAFYGKEGLPYTLIYDQLGSFLILSTAGIFLLSLYSGREFHWRSTLSRMLRFPAFLAFFLALLLGEGGLPEFLKTPTGWIASTLSPAAMIAVGLQLRLAFPRGERAPFLFALGTKLFLAPLLLLLFFALWGLDGLAPKVTVFESAMAPMVSSSTVAILAGLEAGFVASVLGYGILASFLTVPLIWWLSSLIL